MENIYRGSPKHKRPWQSGKKGSLCPSKKEMPELNPQELLNSSVEYKNKRYAIYERIAFEAICETKTQEGDIVYWHGFPISNAEIPAKVLNDWRKLKKL